jgi:hypothetical protein
LGSSVDLQAIQVCKTLRLTPQQSIAATPVGLAGGGSGSASQDNAKGPPAQSPKIALAMILCWISLDPA